MDAMDNNAIRVGLFNLPAEVWRHIWNFCSLDDQMALVRTAAIPRRILLADTKRAYLNWLTDENLRWSSLVHSFTFPELDEEAAWYMAGLRTDGFDSNERHLLDELRISGECVRAC